MEVHEIKPNIFAFTVSRDNAGLIQTKAGVVVVDTTYCPHQLQEGLEKAGFRRYSPSVDLRRSTWW